MAKKQLSNYKFFPGVVPPAYNQYPNTVALISANRDFIIEEMDSYIRNQILANAANVSSPFYNYSYTLTRSQKCKRDTGYILDAYLYDLTYGGNSLTYAVASRYYINGVIQVISADVEVETHTFVRNLITTYILSNTLDDTPEQDVIEQVQLVSSAEADGISQLTDLANTIIGVIDVGLSLLPDPVAPSSQNNGLLPNAISLLESNKRFIQEEAIAYIQFNVDNNTAPYVNYTYNAEKCRRDISYILEGYISDIKRGGNRQTYFNAGLYWENGVAQVDGDRQPEIFAHTFIRDLIDNFIWTNTAFTSRQIIVNQVIDNSIVAEEFAQTRLKELSNIILDVIESGPSFLPTKISNRGYIKVPGFFKLKDFLLVTNSSRNTLMYNFADDRLAAEVTYSESYDSSFGGALYGVDKITTLTFDIDTSNMMVTDNIQIFVEGKEQIVKLNSIATDAMERQKVGIPQSMLDADFEYGLQPTKWQALALMRGYPSIYEIPGSDLPVINVVTDASSGTGGFGASLITVTTLGNHGLLVNDPITIKALSNSVSGFSRAEGSFLVAGVPSPNSLTFYAKSRVGSSNGEVLASTYTQLRKAGFYTGSSVGTPSFSVASAGSSGTISTNLITPAGVTSIGFSSAPPPIGAPLSGTGVSAGAQITSVTGSGGTAASTQLQANASIGDTTIDVASTTGIGPGLVFDRGDGQAVRVTDVTGNTVTLSGALTSNIVGTNQTFSGLSGTTSGSGVGATFNISRSPGYSATTASAGNGYVATNTIVILGTSLNGSAPANNCTITVTSASAINSVTALNSGSLSGGTGFSNAIAVTTSASGSGTGLTVDLTTSAGIVTAIAVNAPGQGYTVGETITIGAAGRIATLGSPFGGSGYVTASGVATTSDNGTGATVDIVANAIGGANTGSLTARGSGYSVASGLSTTVSPSGGTGATVNINTVIDGVVATTTLTTPGTGYSNQTYITTYGGSGSGFTVAVSQTGGIIDTATIVTAGSGYSVNDVVTIAGGSSDATITIDTVNNGVITSVSISAKGSGYSVSDVLTVVQSGGSGGQITVGTITNGAITSLTINNRGSGYLDGDILSIAGGTNGFVAVQSLQSPATINVATINAGGAIQSISVAGTAVTAPTRNFISAITISEPTTAQIASANTGITFAAISTIEVTFATAHGFIPGNTITTAITSTGTGAQLAAGPFFVEAVPTPNTIRYTARAAGAISNTLVGVIYGRPDSFFIHRPFDGGVQLGTSGPAHGSTAIRMSKKYIRYQSGKGVMYNTGALFAPSYDIRSITTTGTAIGSIITVTTDDTDHGCQVGGVITITGVETAGYNGTYTVATIVNERVFTFINDKVLGSASPILGSPCQMSVKNWHGATVRAGIFDDQNGMFYQYDGIRMAVGRRSSTFQIAGTISINANSNSVVGSNTRFTQQLAAGDRIVIRGMSHVVAQIASDTAMTVAPDFRGVSNVDNVKICKTLDILIPQTDWNLDTCNGSGPTGYNIDVTKMQMIGLQHTWYGAGFIDFMLRGSEGNYTFAHRFRNSNVNSEAYMRTGNQPVRYEVINEAVPGRLSAAMTNSQTFIPMNAEDLYWFPTSGVVYIDNELIAFTGKTDTALVGCTRAAPMTQFVAGSNRSFTAGAAATHAIRAGVVLVSNTVTPIISHWGSAFMIDGQFDSDRGYLFNYATTGLSASGDKNTAFLIRLAPSVSNALIGDLGEKELLNRAQLLLSSLSITSDSVTGGGAIVVEGILNPSNYPTNPANINWTGLGSQSSGGQPSFAQIAAGGSVTWSGNVSTSTATVQGAFTRTLTAKSFAPSSNTLTAKSFGAVTQTLTAKSFGQSVTALSFSLNITALGFATNQPFGSAGYERATSTNRSDILITNAQYNSLGFPIQAGDTLTSANLSGGRAVISVTPSYLGTIYTRIVMSANASTNSTAGTGQNVAITVTISATRTTRNDIYITDAQYNGLAIPMVVGDLLTSANLTGGTTVSSITTSYLGTGFTRIVLSANPVTTSTAGTGNNVSVTVNGTYGRAISSTRSDFLITDAQYAALTTAVVATDPLSATTFLVGSQTVSSVTTGFITISSVSYTRIVMSGNGSANSTLATSIGSNDVTVTITSSRAATYNTAISASRTDFLITQAQFASSGALATDVLSASTVLTGGQTIGSITPNFVTIAGVSYARVVMTAVGNATSTAGSGNDVSVTATSALTALYGSAIRNNRLDFLVTDAEATGSGIQLSDVLSATTVLTGSQIISAITPSYVTIGGVPHTRIVMSVVGNATSTAGSGNDVTVTITAAQTASSYANKNFLFFTSTSWLASGATIGTRVATSVGAFPAGTSVNQIETRTFGATTVYKIGFNQTANTSINAAATITWQFGAQYALPGEQVFSFIANPGETQTLNLEPLKELTATALGGRGTFPNGPDVLAINVYKVAGTATNTNVILRWSEAQA
jgi:hypothetical protein